MNNKNKAFSRYLFVINPIAGGNDKNDLISMIEKLRKENGFTTEIYQTTGENDGEAIQKLIDETQPEVIVAAGGDGTVNQVAKLILNKDIALGIIPLGSGNGLAKDLKIPQISLRNALRLIIQPQIIPIDTLEANGNFFMHISDLGFNAHVVKLFNKAEKRGLWSYMRFTIKEFFKYKTFRYQIQTDKGNVKGLAFMITVANSNQFGSNLTINPEGEYDDGEFEIIIIRRFPRKKIFGIIFRLLTKKINFSPYTKVLKCKNAVIKTRKAKTLQYDGEIFGKVKKVEINIHPQSLNVIVPKE